MGVWVHNPCRLGVAKRFKAGGHKQKWPTSGPGGYITPAALGLPNTSKQGIEAARAHKWARCLHDPGHFWGLQRFKAGRTITSGPQKGRPAT